MKTNEVPDIQGTESLQPLPTPVAGSHCWQDAHLPGAQSTCERRRSWEGFPEVYAGRKGRGHPRH